MPIRTTRLIETLALNRDERLKRLQRDAHTGCNLERDFGGDDREADASADPPHDPDRPLQPVVERFRRGLLRVEESQHTLQYPLVAEAQLRIKDAPLDALTHADAQPDPEDQHRIECFRLVY